MRRDNGNFTEKLAHVSPVNGLGVQRRKTALLPVEATARLAAALRVLCHCHIPSSLGVGLNWKNPTPEDKKSADGIDCAG